MDSVQSFKPIVDHRTRVLILGTMPGVVSLERGEYYAHPRNRLWRIMEELVGVPAEAEYQAKLQALLNARVGLWDTLRECVRQGSLDSMIRKSEPNDFTALLAEYPGIAAIGLNGSKAAGVFRTRIRPTLPAATGARLTVLELPSTSPANARGGFRRLLSEWQVLRPWVATEV